MDDRNPYAPSRASLNLTDPVSTGDGRAGVWRDGDVLVKLLAAEMPDRCVKCNRPADEPTKARKVYWHHPALYLLILFNIIIYAIVAAVVRRSTFVRAGLCQEHKQRRRVALVLAWSGLLGGFALMFFEIDTRWGAWAMLVGVLLVLGSVIGGMMFGRVVYAQKIDKSHARLKGCGHAFLDSLPAFSGEPD